MTEFFRPEAKAFLHRWREVFAGLALGALALWFMLGPGQLLAGVGAICAVVAVLLVIVGVQRGRFRGDDGGVGAVRVVEGQVAYFGPLHGGAVSLRNLARLTLDPSGHPVHWKLEAQNGETLWIPVDAAGAEALFDAFAALPGLDMARMLQALQSEGKTSQVIWEHRSVQASRARLQ